MPGLVPGIHVLLPAREKTWLAGSSPAMTRSEFGSAAIHLDAIKISSASLRHGPRGRCHGTPSLSETRRRSCRRRCRARRQCAGRAAIAASACERRTSAARESRRSSRRYHRGRGGEAPAGTGTLASSLAPPSLGLASAPPSLGLASPALSSPAPPLLVGGRTLPHFVWLV